MSHDKVKAAARRRMTATGEPYSTARRHVLSEHAVQSTSPVSAEDVRAAAEAHRELGPEYSDAVVAAFLEKVDSAVAARVEARLADQARSRSPKRAARGPRPVTRRVARDVLAAGAGALVAVSAVGLHAITTQHPRPAVSKLAAGPCARRAGGGSRCAVPPPPINVRGSVENTGGSVEYTFVVMGNGKAKVVYVLRRVPIHPSS